MHHTAQPTEQQMQKIAAAALAAADYARAIGALLPDGRNKDRLMHRLRALALVIDEYITHTDYES